jgi:hypothetical protein
MTADAPVSIPLGVRLVDPAGIEYPCKLTWGGLTDGGIAIWVIDPGGIDTTELLEDGWKLRARSVPPGTAITLAVPRLVPPAEGGTS